MRMYQQLFNSKDFRVFLFRLTIFLFLLAALDFGVGKILRNFYFRQTSGPDYEANYAITKSREQLMIFGSSRARHHYYPPAFEKKLDLTSYNAGRNGNFILYSNAVLQSVLQRHTPDVVLLDIVKHEFEEYPPAYEHLSVLLPYYEQHPEIRSTILKRGKFERVKLLSRMYPFNSTLVSIALGNTEYNKSREEIIDGYGPLRRQMNTAAIEEENPGTYTIDTALVNAYEQFIVSCKTKGVNLFVASSPYYNTIKNTDTSLVIARQIAEKHGVPFFDFSQDTNYTKRSTDFYDKDHLNHEAATRFSEQVADSIRKRMSETARN